ncbi:MAG: electron transport protein SCO1/SenC [Deltaproteobacteria bacterium]|nr:electron transport protein SCO1/SenC [Deltaproteobacteria bacterium]
MLLVFLLAVVPAIFVPTLMCRQPDPELPDLGPVPAFTLVDERGYEFTQEALRGHPTIVDFVFTRCDTICPVVSSKMERLQDKTGDRKASALKLLSISVDPEYDTPARLAEYATRYHADVERWRFLTGPKDKVTALVTGAFMINMDRDGPMPSGAPSIAHQGYFVLVDAELRIRGVYDSRDQARLDELVHHARFLVRTGVDRSYKFGGP